MKIISHRGNIDGPQTDRENQITYIDEAIKLGYDVEVDLRILDGQFYLGHDYPQYKVDLDWMVSRSDYVWFHCKEQESALKLIETEFDFKFFCHSNDRFVLTSNGFLWVHDLDSIIDKKCIIPLLSEEDIFKYNGDEPGYVCTDFVNKINI